MPSRKLEGHYGEPCCSSKGCSSSQACGAPALAGSANPHKALRARLNRDPAFLEFGNKVLVAVGAVGELGQVEAQLDLDDFKAVDVSESGSDNEGGSDTSALVDDFDNADDIADENHAADGGGCGGKTSLAMDIEKGSVVVERPVADAPGVDA